MNKIFVIVISSFFILINSINISGTTQTISSSLSSYNEIDEKIIDEMDSKHIPGLSAAIVIDDEVVWQNSYGYANIEEDRYVDNDTLFKIASVSKTITATALMQLYEQNYFDLQDSINDYLPYNVIHPQYPSKDITFHMLLTHSSGINDNWDYMFHFVGDSPISFQTFLGEYLIQGGLFYNETNNFCSWEPGTSWRYSNVGVALVGYLVEIISGMNFTSYCENNIFEPLEMEESGWYLRDLDESHIAMPYHWNGIEYEPYGHIGWVDVPAGDLRTSSSQLIKFLTMYIQNGSYNSQKILDSDTVSLMLTPQLPFNQNLGLIWWKSNIGERIVWGHGGSDYGARAQMYFDNKTKIGVVVLTNGESNTYQISDIIFNYAEELMNNSQPNPPKINGPNTGKTGVVYNFTFNATDPDNDPVMYYVNWGDNSIEWTEYSDSGLEITLKHTWMKKGDFIIKAKAIDNYGYESNWTEYSITISKEKSIVNSFFLRFLDRHPILNILFQRLSIN